MTESTPPAPETTEQVLFHEAGGTCQQHAAHKEFPPV